MNSDPSQLAPSWLNKKFFDRILKGHFDEKNIIMRNVRMQPGTTVGDHFGSEILRVQIIYTENNLPEEKILSVIVKMMPFSDGLKKMALSKSYLFDNEIRMYKDVLPKMEDAMFDGRILDRTCPRLLYASLKPLPIILLEDLKVKKYEFTGNTFDLDGTKICASMIAKFHAASMKLKETGENLSIFNRTYFQRDINYCETYLRPLLDLVITEIKTWPDYTEHGQKLENYFDKNFELVRRLYCEPDQAMWCVLNHADFHLKNILVKYNGEAITNAMLVDYQVCLWTSPALDVLYLLYMVANLETRKFYRDAIVQHYHKELEDALNRMKYVGKIPAYKDLLEELKFHQIQELLLVLSFSHLQYMDFTGLDSTQIFQLRFGGGFSINEKVLRHPEYQKSVKYELDRWTELGFI